MPERRTSRAALLLGALLSVAAVAGSAAAAGSGASRAGASPRPAELVVWDPDHGAERLAFEKVLALYNGGVRRGGPVAVARAVPRDELAPGIAAAVRRGDGPDLFIAGHRSLGAWVESGDVLSAPPALDSDTMARFLPVARRALTWRGVVWGLPLDLQLPALVYDRALVHWPPRTTAGLLAVARQLTDRRSGRYGLAAEWTSFPLAAALVHAFLPAGEDALFDADGRVRLADPAHRAALALLRSWRDAGILAPATTAAEVLATFNHGGAAMAIAPASFLGDVAPGRDVGVANLPGVSEAGGAPMRPWITVEAVFLSAGARDRRAALALAKHLTSTTAGRVLALEGRQVPASKTVYLDPRIAADPVLARYVSQSHDGRLVPSDPRVPGAWRPLDALMRSALAPATRADAAIDAALVAAERAITAGAEPGHGDGEASQKVRASRNGTSRPSPWR